MQLQLRITLKGHNDTIQKAKERKKHVIKEGKKYNSEAQYIRTLIDKDMATPNN